MDLSVPDKKETDGVREREERRNREEESSRNNTALRESVNRERARRSPHTHGERERERETYLLESVRRAFS